MSFQQSLEDAQQLNETFAFLDGLDVSAMGTSCAAACMAYDTDSTLCSSSASDFGGSPSCNEFATDSDDSLSSLLFSPELACEFATDWEVTTAEPMLESFEASFEPFQIQPQQQSKPPQRTKALTGSKKVVAAATTAPAATTKKPRKHNRIEILKLREEVEELQARQAKLQKLRSDRQQQQQMQKSSGGVAGGVVFVSMSVAAAAQLAVENGTSKQRKSGKKGGKSSATAVVASAPRSVWFDLAVEQYRELQQSETLNRKLRDAVAKQLKVTNSFQFLLQKKVSSQDLDLLMEIPSTDKQPVQLLSPHDLKMAELCASMERQFLETDLVCHRIGLSTDASSVFTTSQVKTDAVYGPTFELLTNTPVANSYELLGRTMWERIVEKKGALAAKPSPRQPQQPLKSPSLLAFHDKHVQTTVAGKLGDVVVDGMIALSKFEESHRIVITIASSYSVADSCLVLRENGWIIVSDSTARLAQVAEPETSSIWGGQTSPSTCFQTFYRLRSEMDDPASPSGSSPIPEALLDEKTRYTQELVMKNLSDKMRQHMMLMQQSLLAQAGGFDAYMSNANCPILECAC